MKYLNLFLLIVTSVFFIPVSASGQEEEELETISIHDFVEMLEQSTDSIFSLSHVQISLGEGPLPVNFDPKHSDSVPILEIDKEIEFFNVIFHPGLAFNNIHFAKTFDITQSYTSFYDCTFEKAIELNNIWKPVVYQYTKSDKKHDDYYSWRKAQISIKNCVFYDKCFISMHYSSAFSSLHFEHNQIFYETDIPPKHSYGEVAFYIDSIENVIIRDNDICNKTGSSFFDFGNIQELNISSNTFDLSTTELSLRHTASVRFNRNTFHEPFVISIDNLESISSNSLYQTEEYYNWEDFKGKLIDLNGLQHVYDQEVNFSRMQIEEYRLSFEFQDQYAYNSKMILFGKFMNHYQNQHNREWANLVYQEMKDLQTKRFKYLYKQKPTFQSYFKWKINQFLEVFSLYGTEPARSIVFSAYIILMFALIYIFFPNSWDERNKHRIMNRMLFFAKYFKKKEGMKEVFDEENKDRITVYEDFKTFMTNNKNEIPPYFDTLAKPIYNLSVANYKLRSGMLNKADILKGKWSELGNRRRLVTSVIMAFWLIGIIAYDIFVKFFNALMLSINTFSTLGFGEIPIKGIPRYLAIIEGFLGWFMLTIFSVSLISQLIQL